MKYNFDIIFKKLYICKTLDFGEVAQMVRAQDS